MPGSLSGQSSSGTNTAGFLGSGSPFRRRGGRVFILEAIRLGLQWPWTAGSSSGDCLVQEVQKGICEAADLVLSVVETTTLCFWIGCYPHLQYIYIYTQKQHRPNWFQFACFKGAFGHHCSRHPKSIKAPGTGKHGISSDFLKQSQLL